MLAPVTFVRFYVIFGDRAEGAGRAGDTPQRPPLSRDQNPLSTANGVTLFVARVPL